MEINGKQMSFFTVLLILLFEFRMQLELPEVYVHAGFNETRIEECFLLGRYAVWPHDVTSHSP
jgi:hypothetical protein